MASRWVQHAGLRGLQWFIVARGKGRHGRARSGADRKLLFLGSVSGNRTISFAFRTKLAATSSRAHVT
eukprot:8762352-Prorocentrum_lima.AAC.1